MSVWDLPVKDRSLMSWPDAISDQVDEELAQISRPFDSEAALAFSVDYEDGPPTVRDLGVHDRGRRA